MTDDVIVHKGQSVGVSTDAPLTEVAGRTVSGTAGIGIWPRIARSQDARFRGDTDTALEELTFAVVQLCDALRLRETVDW